MSATITLVSPLVHRRNGTKTACGRPQAGRIVIATFERTSAQSALLCDNCWRTRPRKVNLWHVYASPKPKA